MDMKDEAWLKARYDALPADRRPEYSLVSLKLKRFRALNQLVGRRAGDELIEQVFQVLQNQLKQEEWLAQIHLEHFNLLVRWPRDYEQLFQFIIQLNACIRDLPDVRFSGRVFTGFGVCQLTEDPLDFYTAQYQADTCRAECPQAAFRNSHLEVYGLTFQDKTLQYLDLLQTVQPALDDGQIRMYLQPKVDLRTGEVTKAEALVRWIDPVRGMIPVSEFLPILEDNGLISNVDLFIFEQVCRVLRRWQDRFGKKIAISVNLSGCMFNYRYYFKDYKQIHQKYDAPKDCIEFELLESIVLNQVQRVQEVVNELRDYGFSYSLDDFGSGYSSFSVLTNTHFSAIKIDRSLFNDSSSRRERVLIRHIIETAHELGAVTVAEGVETREYVDYLKQLGCEYIQGFYFYKPMPVDEFERRFVIGDERASV